MSAISKAVAEEKLAMWLAALDKIAAGQSYTINGRSLSRADLSKVQDQIVFWEKRVNRATSGGIRVSEAVPRG